MRTLLCLLVSSTLLFAGCGEADSPTDSADPALAGRAFWSTAVVENGEPLALVDGTRLVIRFREGNELSADAGCNNLGGSYTIDGTTLVVGDLFQTEMGCDPARHAQDDFLIGLLTARPELTVTTDVLTLSIGATSVDFVSREIAQPDQPLHGPRWTVDGFFDQTTATNYATDSPAYFEFDEARFFGFDGCASFELTHELVGDALRIDSAPGGGCSPYGDAVAAAFAGREFVVQITGNRLTLTAADGTGLTARAD